MESGGQRRQIVIASAVAVVAGLALAASVYYTFGSGQMPYSTIIAGGPTATIVSTITIVNTTTVTKNTVVNGGADSIDCSNVTGHVLYLGSQPIRLAANGTSSINGSKYWYGTFIPMWNGTNKSTIQFQGVNFTITAPDPSAEMKMGETWSISNGTLLTTSTHGGLYCGYYLPPIKIGFEDGSSAVYNGETVTVGANGGAIKFDRPSSNPWFTQHTSPLAGVGYRANGGEITLYVSS